MMPKLYFDDVAMHIYIYMYTHIHIDISVSIRFIRLKVGLGHNIIFTYLNCPPTPFIIFKDVATISFATRNVRH